MTQYRQNFNMVQGYSRIVDFTILNPDGTPLNLTGKTLLWYIGPKTPGAAPLLTKGVGTGLTVTNAAAGQLRARIEQDEINDVGLLRHQLIVTDGADSEPVSIGEITVNEGF